MTPQRAAKMSSFLISPRLSSKLVKLSPSSSVPFHFTSQETQNHGFRFCAHYSMSPFSQQQNPSTQNKHGFTLSKMETSRYFSTFIRERTQIPDVKNKEMTSTKPLSSSIYTHITNQKPRYLSSSSDPEKSQNDPSKLPSFKHQETEKLDESSEALVRWEMKKIFSRIKILCDMGLLQTGLDALISYMTEGTISILRVSLLSGIFITISFAFIQLAKSLQFEILSREGVKKLWPAKVVLFLLQLMLVTMGIFVVFQVFILMLLLGIDV